MKRSHRVFFLNLNLKVPYKALTSTNKKELNSVILMKGYTNGIVSKPGYIRKDELQSIADTSNQSRYTIIKKLNILVNAGLVQKNKYGYTLTSINKVLSQLNLDSITKKKGKKNPFLKVELSPSTSNHYQLELLKLYYLIQQIYSQRQFRLNASATRRLNKSSKPERFELSLEKIMLKGKYNNKMTISRMLSDLQRVGLIAIYKGMKGNQRIGMYDCNQYTLHPISKVNWNKLNKRDWTDTKTKRKIVTPTIQRKQVKYTNAELKFQNMLDSGLQDILVDAGILSNTFKSFGRKKGRKVTKTRYSELLAYCLNDLGLRKILLTQISMNEIFINDQAEGYYYDRRLNTYHKDRFTFFQFDEVSLVDDSTGNYSDFEDVVLVTKKQKNTSIYIKLKGTGENRV